MTENERLLFVRHQIHSLKPNMVKMVLNDTWYIFSEIIIIYHNSIWYFWGCSFRSKDRYLFHFFFFTSFKFYTKSKPFAIGARILNSKDNVESNSSSVQNSILITSISSSKSGETFQYFDTNISVPNRIVLLLANINMNSAHQPESTRQMKSFPIHRPSAYHKMNELFYKIVSALFCSISLLMVSQVIKPRHWPNKRTLTNFKN